MNKFKNLKAPFDLVLFPSMGLFYENKKSFALISYLTGREEDILTSPMLVEHGMAMDLALKNVILDEDIDINKLLVGDKNAILLFLRATAYGPNFDLQMSCKHCGELGKTSFNVSELTAKDLVIPPDSDGEFTYVLSKMKLNKQPVVVKFKPLTYADEKIIKQISKQQESQNGGISTLNTLRYIYQIVSINGITDKENISNIIKKMPIKDSNSLRNFMNKVEPGINNLVSLKCSHCNVISKEEFEIDDNILSIPIEYKNSMWDECFILWYYGKGGIDRHASFEISVAERKWSIQRINEELEKKQKAQEAAQGNSSIRGK